LRYLVIEPKGTLELRDEVALSISRQLADAVSERPALSLVGQPAH
jgi:hypothetical protein